MRKCRWAYWRGSGSESSRWTGSSVWRTESIKDDYRTLSTELLQGRERWRIRFPSMLEKALWHPFQSGSTGRRASPLAPTFLEHWLFRARQLVHLSISFNIGPSASFSSCLLDCWQSVIFHTSGQLFIPHQLSSTRLVLTVKISWVQPLLLTSSSQQLFSLQMLLVSPSTLAIHPSLQVALNLKVLQAEVP